MLLASSKRLLTVAVCVLSCLGGLANAGPIDNPSIVNTSLPGNQAIAGLSSLVASGNGEKLLHWMDYPAATGYVQRISSAGVLSPTKMAVPVYSYGISTDRVGNFTVTSANANITLYDRNGNIRTSSFRPHLNASSALTSMDADGNLSIFYSTSVNQTSALALRRFTAAGIPLGNETQVLAPIANTVSVNTMVSDAAGNITVSWIVVNNSSSNNLALYMQRFNSQAQPITSPTIIPSTLPGARDGGVLATSPQGSFVIAWNSTQDGLSWDSYVLRFNASGYAVGSPIRLNQTTQQSSPQAHVSMTEDGSFVATWRMQATPPATGYILYARQFMSDGTPIGNEFQVDPGFANVFYANSAIDKAGNFTIAWTAANQPVSDYDVKMRSYKLDTQPAITSLTNGQPAQGLAGGTGSWKYFKVTVPPGATQMNVSMAGPAGGDGDMYIRFGGLPSATAWDIRPYVNGSNEVANINNPPPSDFYIAIYGYAAYSGVSLNVSYY